MRKFLLMGTFYGATGVALGAFGAHGLEDYLKSIGRVDTYDTAVMYQMWHALLLVALGLAGDKLNVRFANLSGWFTSVGVLIFSGSLYMLCMTQQLWLGAITPFGGVGLIGGWLFLLIAGRKGV